MKDKERIAKQLASFDNVKWEDLDEKTIRWNQGNTKETYLRRASQISALFNTEEISEILKGTTVTKFKLLVNNGKPFECNGDCSNIINKGDWFGNEVFPDGNELNLCLYHSSAIMSNVNKKCFDALNPDQKQEVCTEKDRL